MNTTQGAKGGSRAGRTVIAQVRDLMPRRPLSITEAYSIAEKQAYTLLDLLDIHGPHVTYDKLLALPNIEIMLQPGYLLEHISGLSHFHQGRWLIVVDKNDIHGRRRFTLAHEFKHIIDHPFDQLVYARLGYGDEQRQHAHIEALCQHFAACFLMPKTWVKNSWANGIQDVYNLASLFQVSVSAMDVRLRSLGLLDDDDEENQRAVSTYFRSSAPSLFLMGGAA
jgi:Zn-dependent peptidase ImmA (M78 family)